MLQRTGASPIWIPDEAITAIRRERGIAGKAFTHQTASFSPSGGGYRRALR